MGKIRFCESRYDDERHSAEADALLQRVAHDILKLCRGFFSSAHSAVSLFTDESIKSLRMAYLTRLEEHPDIDPHQTANGVVTEGVLQSTLPTLTGVLSGGAYRLLKPEDLPPYPNMVWTFEPQGNIRIAETLEAEDAMIIEWDAALAAIHEEPEYGTVIGLDTTTSAKALFTKKTETHDRNYIHLHQVIRRSGLAARRKFRVLNILIGEQTMSLRNILPKGKTTRLWYIEMPGRNGVNQVARALEPDFSLSAADLRQKLSQTV